MTYGPGGNLWRTVLDVDFTAQSNQNLKSGGDGAKTIAGLTTWSLLNSANCTSVDITAGTGLVFVASATNTLYNGATHTTPMLMMLMNDVFSAISFKDYSLQSHMVRMMARVQLTGADADFENGMMGVEDATAPTNQNFYCAKGRNGGDRITAGGASTAVTTNWYVLGTSFTDDVLGLNFEAPDMVEAWTGIYDTAAARLPYQFSTHRGSYSSNLSTPLFRQNIEPRIFLAQETGNVTGAFTTTFTHLRVDVASKSPPR